MPNLNNRISGVMVTHIASSSVDRGFEPQSGQTKHYNIIQSLTGIGCYLDLSI